MARVPFPGLGVVGRDEEVRRAGDVFKKLMAPGRWLDDRHRGLDPLLVTKGSCDLTAAAMVARTGLCAISGAGRCPRLARRRRRGSPLSKSGLFHVKQAARPPSPVPGRRGAGGLSIF